MNQIHPMDPIQHQPMCQNPMRRQQKSYAMTVPGGYQAASDGCYEGMISCLGFGLGTLGSIPCCFCFPNPFKEVHQGTVGLISKFGKFTRAVDPGLYKINPFAETISHVDIKMRTQDIPRQIVMTKDNVSLNIDSVLYWEIVDPYIAIYLVADVQKALIDRTQTVLRTIMGNKTLQDAIEHRDSVGREITDAIDAIAETWGVRVEAILLKDIILPPEILESISSAAQQKRLGEAKVIAAQAEVNSAKLMREAADILSSKAAMQIRYLETLTAMSAHNNTKVIFMPTNTVGMTDATTMETLSRQ